MTKYWIDSQAGRRMYGADRSHRNHELHIDHADIMPSVFDCPIVVSSHKGVAGNMINKDFSLADWLTHHHATVGYQNQMSTPVAGVCE